MDPTATDKTRDAELHDVRRTVWRGAPYPLGATFDGEGVNFALFSEHAERVELCLFDPKGKREVERIDLRERTDFIWHCYLPQAAPGLVYGYRVYGPYVPEQGHRFNPRKLLLDPYAKTINGHVRWTDALFGYRVGSKREDLSLDLRDSASGMPKAVVVDTAFTWGDDRSPATPWRDTILYEAHVKGYTQLHQLVPPQLRGTYLGLACEPVVDYLKNLGITAIELLPVHSFIDDQRLVQHGLRNYWGYNSIGFFAPEGRYALHNAVHEFKTMVRTLHSAGIEVILDVVYNHTAEGNQLGPTLSFRGIDNRTYYRLSAEDPRYHVDFTGTGNTLNTAHPMVLRMIMDSLRYWVTEMHVDGFRFDLATTLTRENNDVDPFGSFLDILRQDPVLARTKLIAEPWDLGENGYQLGGFPPGWSEWNGRYRDTIRSYWKGDDGLIGELASRLSGSSDIFSPSGRGPTASINFITVHDGFTLHDLVSYNDKHNEANLEENRDGESHNRSWNCGVEGITSDSAVRQLRERQKRNLLATLILSQGVPMLLAGDEFGRTQQGNNNAYCQDDEISWMDWRSTPEADSLLRYTRRLIKIRNAHPLFRRRRFLSGRGESGDSDVAWLNPDGRDMSDEEWHQSFARCLGVFLLGHGLAERDEHGKPITDDDLLLLLNAHHEEIQFLLPAETNEKWHAILDTACDEGLAENDAHEAGSHYPLQGRSLVLLCRHRA